MATDKKGAAITGKRLTVKSVAGSSLAQGKGKRTQSEVVAKAFATASKRTGTFMSKYAK